MRLSIEHGFFWFYSIQEPFSRNAPYGSNLVAWPNTHTPHPVPFWVVKKVKATVTDDGLTQVMPLEWDSVVPDVSDQKHRFWRPPTPSIFAFLTEFGLVREKAYEHMLATALFSPDVEYALTLNRPDPASHLWRPCVYPCHNGYICRAFAAMASGFCRVGAALFSSFASRDHPRRPIFKQRRT